jgi:predicted transcriptional regulator
MIDLRSFREDAHLAAWQPFDVSGQLWEVLTFVWRDEAGTAAELAEKLPSRGYDEGSYAAALQDLAARGWVAQENGKYVTTEKGSQVRQQAEDTTDRYFDAPWASLSQDETEELKGLLEKLAQVVEVTEEQEPA